MWEWLAVIAVWCCIWAWLPLVVWPDQGCTNFLSDFESDRLGNAAYVFRLYTNNVTPGTGTVIGSFVEAAFAGYVPVGGNTITWNAPALVGHVATANGTPINFVNSSGAAQTVYGVYVTNAAGTKLYFAELDPLAPISIPIGGTYTYVPNQQFESIN
jgi:hypothetical protein